MSTPLLIAARKLWPEARLALLGKASNCELLAACPWLDECYVTTALPFSLRGRRGLAEVEQWLRDSRFDVAIIALGDEFAALLAKVGIPVIVGVKGHVLEPCLTHTYDIGSPRTWGPSERLNALRILGNTVEDEAPRLWLSDSMRSSTGRRLSKLGLADDEEFAVVHPFGSTALQRWPVERVQPLAEALRRDHGLSTVVVGGPDARGQVRSDSSIIDASGILSLSELLEVIERSRLVVSTDSGPFHIAGALGRPLVGLFRSSRPEHARRYPQAQVVFGHDGSCKGRCRWDHCRALPCRQMDQIQVVEVANAANRCLGQVACDPK